MRQRLVAAFVGLTIVVVSLYGIPRAYFLADLIRGQEQQQVDQLARVSAVAIDQRTAAGLPVDTVFLDSLVDADDEITVLGTDGAASNGYAEPGTEDLTARVDLDDGRIALLSRNSDAVGDDIAQALLPLVLIGLALVLVAGLAAAALARRLARPFQDLAVAASGLGAGDLHPTLPASTIPEARAIGEALRTSGSKLSALLEHERELATRASHELRTPLTALRLELEDLAQWPETPAAVGSELHRATDAIDRLSEAITGLLDRAKEQLSIEAIDLDVDALVTDVVGRLSQQGRRVTHISNGVLPTHLDPAPVVEVLERLVGAVPGTGYVRVQTRDAGSHYEVSIPTDLSGMPDWERTVELAAAFGHLSQVAGTVVLRLPKRPLAGTKEGADRSGGTG